MQSFTAARNLPAVVGLHTYVRYTGRVLYNGCRICAFPAHIEALLAMLEFASVEHFTTSTPLSPTMPDIAVSTRARRQSLLDTGFRYLTAGFALLVFSILFAILLSLFIGALPS
ncbi:MAG: hypothetical protein ACREUA_03160, partial [Burkholderiales bacterium]